LIYDKLHDTEGWSNDAAITGINYILKYIKTEINAALVSILFKNILKSYRPQTFEW